MTSAHLPALAAEDHHCDHCGFRYGDHDPAAAPAVLTEVLAELRAVLDETPADVLRTRPDDMTWSIVEYLCHLRDVLVTSTIRLHRARYEDRPAVEPMYNDLRARRFGYRDADPVATTAELDAAAAGFLTEMSRTRPTEWARTLTRLPGEERTALWVLRNALHECRHHTADIRRLAG